MRAKWGRTENFQALSHKRYDIKWTDFLVLLYSALRAEQVPELKDCHAVKTVEAVLKRWRYKTIRMYEPELESMLWAAQQLSEIEAKNF
jgi:hypothetical protein